MRRREAGWLLLLGLIFLAWHVPLMFRTAAGMDEEFYGVTGITVQREGVPRVPYVPSRDRRFVFGVDILVYTLPPLSFYLQGLVHLVLGPGLGQARLASAIEGLAAAWLVFDLARRWLPQGSGALWAPLLYLFGRAAFFPATTARPDMAATTFGLLSVWCLVRDGGVGSRVWLSLAGFAGGLSMLSHPFGIVPCLQGVLWLLIQPESWRLRLRNGLVFGLGAIAGFSLWLPLIALRPDLFWIQFQTNVLGRVATGESEGTWERLTGLTFQGRQFLATVLPLQATLHALGAIWCMVQARHSRLLRALFFHLAVSLTLLVVLMGRHSLRAYFALPVAFGCIAAAGFVAWAAGRLSAKLGRLALIHAAATGFLIASLVPGSGLRTLKAHLSHWNDPAYDGHAVARRMMADLDPQALIVVDDQFILDFYLAGRRVVDAKYMEYLSVDYDYLLASPLARLASKIPPEDLEWVRRYGDPANEFTPGADLYRRVRKQPATRNTHQVIQ